MIFFDSYSISCIECWIWINIYLGKRRTLGCSFGCYSERWGIVLTDGFFKLALSRWGNV